MVENLIVTTTNQKESNELDELEDKLKDSLSAVAVEGRTELKDRQRARPLKFPKFFS